MPRAINLSHRQAWERSGKGGAFNLPVAKDFFVQMFHCRAFVDGQKSY